jgi:NADH-quinone oxidoreductase subunit J
MDDSIRPFLFWTTALLTCLCAVATVVSQNIVRTATYLLFALAGVAVLFFMLNADFVGSAQLLVYVGGTLVLVVFAVMLTAQGPFITMTTSAWEYAASGVVGFLLLGMLTVTALQAREKPGDPATKPDARTAPLAKKYAPERSLTTRVTQGGKAVPDPAANPVPDLIGEGFLGIGVGPAHEENGTVARTHYFLPFIIVSVHLLVVLIGAAYLARAKRSPRAAA